VVNNIQAPLISTSLKADSGLAASEQILSGRRAGNTTTDSVGRISGFVLVRPISGVIPGFGGGGSLPQSNECVIHVTATEFIPGITT
jgi:hypothetical protein